MDPGNDSGVTQKSEVLVQISELESPSSFPGIFLQSSPFLSASLLRSPLEFLLPVYKYPQVRPILKPKPSPSVASPPPSSPVRLVSLALPQSLPLQQNFLKALPPKPPLPPGKAAQRLSPPHPHGWVGSSRSPPAGGDVSNPASQFVNRTLSCRVRAPAFRPGTALRVFFSCNALPNHFGLYCLFRRGGSKSRTNEELLSRFKSRLKFMASALEHYSFSS